MAEYPALGIGRAGVIGPSRLMEHSVLVVQSHRNQVKPLDFLDAEYLHALAIKRVYLYQAVFAALLVARVWGLVSQGEDQHFKAFGAT